FYLAKKYAPAGRGKYKEPEEGSNVEFIPGTSSDTHNLTPPCRMCGQAVGLTDLVCPHCHSPSALSDQEKERVDAQERAANYDPWDVRVKAKTANEYEKYFQAARDLSQTSDVQAAIENCRRALSEDPHRKEGYLLLAELYDGIGKRDEAAKCYREVLLIDPSEIIVRQKIEALLSLSSKPLRISHVAIGVAAALWWLIYWTVIGIDPYAVWSRAALCVAGGALTFAFWKFSEKSRRRGLMGNQRGAIDVYRPLPTEKLTYRSQTRQAAHISKAIREHMGVEVPVLSSFRLYAIAGLSVLVLISMIWVGWVNHTPWILAGWPAAVLLLIFTLEVYPRAYIAHVILRHVFEETSSPWADPHRPFKPKGQELKGEFLIGDYEEFPLRWALNPFPHPPNRQGVLDSLQQTLNRHWSCHKFYEGLHVVRDVDIPMPMNMRPVVLALLLLTAAAAFAASSITAQRSLSRSSYNQAIKAGYVALLDGDIEASRAQFLTASMLDSHATLPLLYLAHTNAALGFAAASERCFVRAVKRAGNVAVIRNDYGNFLQKRGKMKDAIVQYIAALERDPDNADVLNNLGSGYYRLREYDKAAKQLVEATRVDPQHQRAWTTLGLAYEGMGDETNAKAAYKRALAVAPDLPYTQIARDRLAASDDPKSQLTLKEPDGKS
ncbi:MAG: tetratricopeptide repeat protein, partial [Candidatus Sumerlaeota bacterium]